MSFSKTYNLIGLVLFWGWNILSVFLLVFLIGYAVLPYVLMATINGEIPLSITVCLLILMFIPVYAIYFGIKRPDKAVAFFFGVEIPVIILTLFRVFIVRELTLGSGFLLLTAFVAIGVFAWSLRGNESLIKLNPIVSTAAATLVLLTGVYVGILSALYAFPWAVEFFKGVFSFKWADNMRYFEAIVFLIMALFVFGSLAFFAFPVYVAWFYPKLWKQKGRDIREGFSGAKYYITSAGFAALWLGVFTLVSHQGQADYVSRLNDMTVAEKQTEMQNPNRVRKRLLSAYLNDYRYLGTVAQGRNLVAMYRRSLGSKSAGETAQNIQSTLLQPLFYKGGTRDGLLAGRLYSELFDSSIQRDEKKAITKALEATFNRDEVTAGLMNIGARNVLIREQNIGVKTQGRYAAVEIEEVYENLTFENQEIFYYFSLPEDAAITGLWIGRTDKREDMDAYIVAPRGAAQKVYEQQVRRNIDPALLEQVGPAQYRLRVFPIPVTRRRSQFSSRRRFTQRSRAPRLMRIQMEYSVPTGGTAPLLPVLLEKRNVDWSRKTKRMLNGVKAKRSSYWMPLRKTDSTAKPASDSVEIPVGDNVMTLGPVSTLPNTPLGKLAVIVDTSFSMAGQEDSLRRTVSELNDLKSAGLAEYEFYIGSADGGMMKTDTFDAKDIKPFGRLTYRQLLKDFADAGEGESYDAVVLLTDQGNYGTDGGHTKNLLNAPLYFLHVDKAAAAYDDDVLDLIYRTGGGVATSVQSLRQQMTLNGPTTRVVENRLWTSAQGKGSGEAGVSKLAGAQALAARQLILIDSFGKPPSVAALDELHAIATTYDVVTPYSSMIVLVNDRQKEALKKESEADDRFEREGRSGEETLSRPANPLVSGVPEPHEWILIILSILMLFWLWRKREDWEFGSAA